MGKVMEKAKITNLLDPTKSVEIEAIVDTGAMMLVLPENVVNKLGLEKIKEVKAKYANGRVETKGMYGVVTLEIQGRVGHFDALAEVADSQPLIGQIILDLVIHPATKTLGPNPESPEMPLVEIL
jgi:predicted aspartyl protease